MICDKIRDLLKRGPFRPFRIQVTSGATYQVRNPDTASRRASCFYLAQPHNDRWVFIPWLQTTAVESLDNGRPVDRA